MREAISVSGVRLHVGEEVNLLAKKEVAKFILSVFEEGGILPPSLPSLVDNQGIKERMTRLRIGYLTLIQKGGDDEVERFQCVGLEDNLRDELHEVFRCAFFPEPEKDLSPFIDGSDYEIYGGDPDCGAVFD